jgi:hypothetical protein
LSTKDAFFLAGATKTIVKDGSQISITYRYI